MQSKEKSHRAEATTEAQLDLGKSARHLLIDVHDELLNKSRNAGENMLHAQKRLASLTLKNAESADALARKVKNLTCVLVWLTIVLTVLTIAVLYYTINTKA